MNQIYPDDGLPYAISELVNGVAGAGLEWCLFINNVVPSLNDVLATYTFSTAWSRQFVPAAQFPAATVTSHIGASQAPNITYTNNTGGPVNVYGYVVLNPTGVRVVAAARFDGALPIVVANGATIQVSPIIGALSVLSA